MDIAAKRRLIYICHRVMADFQPFPSEYVVKGPWLIRAFIREYLFEQNYLQQEQAALVSEAALAVDHQ